MGDTRPYYDEKSSGEKVNVCVKSIMEILILGLTITRLAHENQCLKEKLVEENKLVVDKDAKIEEMNLEVFSQEDELIELEHKLIEKDFKIQQLEDTITVLTKDLYSLAQSSSLNK